MVRVAVRRGGRKRPNAKGIVYGEMFMSIFYTRTYHLAELRPLASSRFVPAINK